MSRPRVTAIALGVILAVGCGSPPPVPRADRAAPGATATVVPVDARRDAPKHRVVFLGDSLTAGLGLPADQSFPSLIEARLIARGSGWAAVNAGVSGDTSAGGARRLEWVLDGGADIVVVALGGNDALRGLPVEDLERNLETIVRGAESRGARVVLAGMEAPPSNGPEYVERFRTVYQAVAMREDVTLIPFLLDGVAGFEHLNQPDGIHPNETGARLVADLVWRTLEPIVADVEKATHE